MGLYRAMTYKMSLMQGKERKINSHKYQQHLYLYNRATNA